MGGRFEEDEIEPGTQAAPVRRGGRQPQLDTGDDEKVLSREQQLERAAALERSDLRHLAGQVQFRRFVERFMERNKAFVRSYDTSKRRLIDEGRAMAAMDLWIQLENVYPDAATKILMSRAKARQERR